MYCFSIAMVLTRKVCKTYRVNQNDGQYNTNAMLLKSKPLLVDKAERQFHHNVDNRYTYTNIFVVVTDADILSLQYMIETVYIYKS